MSQPFTCTCGTETCVGEIRGAGQMNEVDLQGRWLSAHVRRGLEGRAQGREREGVEEGEGKGVGVGDERIVNKNGNANANGTKSANENVKTPITPEINQEGHINERRGVTSREMSGEMGGDTL
ncbi:hypothetical protein SBOR_2225 [Sclerotinia borealis F-4128]|uniref:Post-SET domain-containing protein n=1 Tax=Sclerotinia borealis (strain F-4128) TaxID=1432307 RepID=W9CKT5_SCLBF|nr:hypothetical protein SBOR_2225 [Sclerotinia borealis F-4128]